MAAAAVPPPPHSAAARGLVKSSLGHVLKTYGRDRLELEFRLGHRTGGPGSHFVPGVSAAAWEALKKALDASTDSFRVVVTNTRELICDDGSGGKYVVPASSGERPYWMHKKRLSDIDADTGTPWCCRTSMSLEVVDEGRPSRGPPTRHKFERHKQRWSYVHRCWSIDLTRVASNLPHQLDNDDVSYEVEIELRDSEELFCRTMDNLLEWGWTIVTDVCRLMSQ